jgi:multisubunit Na+/H+ antiporter MnhB subunit
MRRKVVTAVAATAMFLFGCALAGLVGQAAVDPDVGLIASMMIGGTTGLLTGLFIIVRGDW